MWRKKSVNNYLQSLSDEEALAIGGLICEYLGVALGDGAYELNALIYWHSKVGFRWQAKASGVPGSTFQSYIVELVSKNAVSRGVAFPREALVPKDIRQEATESTIEPFKKRAKTQQLLNIVEKNSDAWSYAVAMATWLAESTRAVLENRLPDDDRAFAGFEANPFAWHFVKGDYVKLVTLLWQWRTNGKDEHKFVTSRLKHLLERKNNGLYPCPKRSTKLSSATTATPSH